MCQEKPGTITKASVHMNTQVGLCQECADVLWAEAKRESTKFSEFENAGYEARVFERDGSCLNFDALIDSLARKCVIRDACDHKGLLI